MDALPVETIGRILTFLPPSDLFVCAQVSKEWHLEANHVLNVIGLDIEMPSEIREEIQGSLGKSILDKSIRNLGEEVPIGPPLPPGIVDLLGRPNLNLSHPWSFATVQERIKVTCLPPSTLNFPIGEEDPNPDGWNHNPVFILHPLGRRIFLDPYIKPRASDNIPDPYQQPYIEICLDPRFTVHPTGYAMRHHSKQQRAPRRWLFLGNTALEGEDEWEVIREHVNDKTIPVEPAGAGVWTLEVPKGKAFQRFRIVRTGPSAAKNCKWLHCSGWEIYGTLYLDRK